MPELPEVETIKRTLSPLITGATITKTTLLLPRTLQLPNTLKNDPGSLSLELLHGRRITGTSRRAKLVLIDLEPENQNPSEAHMLAVHLKMTGRLFVYDKDMPPQKHTRVIFDLSFVNGAQKRLFYDDSRTFGYVRIVSPNTLAQWPFWQKLGLEPLEHSAMELAKRLENKQGSIKSLLLNQELVVGIGNIYADEALFRAKIAPSRKANTLHKTDIIRIFEAVQEVLTLSIQECGSSIRDYRDAKGDAGSFQNTFFVYGRGNKPCQVCNHALFSSKVAGRTTVHCPHCQGE